MNADLFTWVVTHFNVFALVLLRVASLLFLMPVYSSATIPTMVKIAGALVLALLLTPVAPFTPDQLPTTGVGFGMLCVGEIFVGMTLALFIRLIFAGLQTAAQMVGFQMGFAVASVVDPQTGAQSIIIAELSYLIALLLFLSVNGHLVLLHAMYESFAVLPPGSLHLQEPLARLVMDMGRQMFVLSVQIMAPVMAILLFSQVALGILAKTVPQMNLLMVSFGLNIGLGLFFLGLTLQVFWPILSRPLDEALKIMPVALKIMAGR